ncbi:FAD/NAD(P)-binding protein [Chitinimonas sp.]|uniref:FAD/NAD(P)-binding protein n=1 Tax=Chitinimonas sp. TaxID=1934313 RepID=UPI002F94C37C
MRTVLIIGAGFSGVACAVQLLRRSGTQPLRILLLNRSGRMARGLAYGTQSPQHTLNVPAGKMSALPDDPTHFLRYARARDSCIDANAFVPRSVYGNYLEWLLELARQTAPAHASLNYVGGVVTRLQAQAGGGLQAQLEDGRTLHADKVVLALGHFPSSDPAVDDMSFYASPRYQRDPWDVQQLGTLAPAAPVLLLGSGLTAMDVAHSLLRQHPNRPIIAVSRHGLLPQAYAPSAPLPPGAPSGPAEATPVLASLRAFRSQLHALAAQGLGWHDALAALRPRTAAIWQAWSPAQRRCFLRHVQPYWDTHRHQLAPTTQQQIATAMAQGTLQILAARITGYREDSEAVHVRLRPRGQAQCTELRATRVINCTGPCRSPRHTGNPLVAQLLADGMLRTDALGLGIDTGPHCAVLNDQGRAAPDLYYLGPWLKANYWEATAVPELRCFAAQVASACLA